MDNRLDFEKLLQMYEDAQNKIKDLEREIEVFKKREHKSRLQIKEFEKELRHKKLSARPISNPLPELTFFNRRVEERRKEDIPVEVDRRSGYDRRKGLRYVRPEFNVIFNDFYPKDRIIHPLILKSNSDRILDAYWELWHLILGYDLKKIKNIREIYLVPEVRDEIIKSVDEKGFYKKGIAVSRSGGGRLIMDSIFIKDPESKQEYYVFLIIDEFQEE